MNEFNSKFNQEIVNKYYASELKKGTNLYGSGLGQTERFKNSLRYFNFKNKPLLDVGCGRGDFFFYLKDKGHEPSVYMGADPFEEMVEIAKERLSKSQIIKKDYLEMEQAYLATAPQIITAFSAFDRKFGNVSVTEGYVEKIIEKMIYEAREGVYATFLSAYKNINDFDEMLFCPEDIFKFARKFSERVVIDNSYMPHAFSLIVYKRKSPWKEAWEKGRWK